MNRMLVIYHADCVDGFTAAWAAWRRLGDTAVYWPAQHGQPPPPVEGRDVVMVDFAYPRPVVLEIAANAKSLLILDHHKTALEQLSDLPFVHLDMEQSGAGLAWRHFHPSVPPPRLVLAVEDGDLWRHRMPSTREIYLRLSFEPRTFANWDRVARQMDTELGLAQFVGEGRMLQEERDFQVERLILRRQEVALHGEKGLAVEAPSSLRSEVGHRLAQLSGTFGLVWFGHAGGTRVSLRSVGDYDVERLARCYGGGGHRNAAGFSLADRDLFRVLVAA